MIAKAESGRLYERVAEDLSGKIAAGQYAVGQRLPSERDLAQAYAVSRPTIREAIIALEMKFGDTIPAGTYLDMAVNLPMVDPLKVKSPVLMIRGEHDGNSTNEDLLDFYRQLPNGDRQFAVLPAAHSLGYSNNRHLLYYVVKNFLAAPAPVQGS